MKLSEVGLLTEAKEKIRTMSTEWACRDHKGAARLRNEKDEEVIMKKAQKLGCEFKVMKFPKKPEDSHMIKVRGTAPAIRDFFYKAFDVDPGSFEESNTDWFPQIYKDEKPIK